MIKEVKNLLNLTLKDAKDKVEKLPLSLKEGVTKDEADKLKTLFES